MMKKNIILLFIVSFLGLNVCLFSTESPKTTDVKTGSTPKPSYITVKDIPYLPENVRDESDAYQKERCCVNISYPQNQPKYKDGRGLPVLIYFHGGGLSAGKRSFPGRLFLNLKLYREGQLILVAGGYRLSPNVPFPVFIQDAAAAIAWTIKNIERYGGDPDKIFVSGTSAGGYLTGMTGMDPRWLAEYGIDNKQLAGLLLDSAQVTTHFLVKKLLKIPGEQYQPVIDENAPIAHLSKELPPIFLLLGDRKSEWKCRTEENELMYASLKALGHPLVEFSETPGVGHGPNTGKETIPPELFQRLDLFFEKALNRK